MKLNAKAEYAVRAMLDLAARPQEQTTLDEVAARQCIPPNVLPNIFQTLAKAALVQTVRGYGGGVRLAQAPQDISVRQVLEAIEGPLELYRCERHRDNCPVGLGRHCPLHSLWQETQSRMLDLWGQTTLADLARGNGKVKSASRRAPGGPRRLQRNRSAA